MSKKEIMFMCQQNKQKTNVICNNTYIKKKIVTNFKVLLECSLGNSINTQSAIICLLNGYTFFSQKKPNQHTHEKRKD